MTNWASFTLSFSICCPLRVGHQLGCQQSGDGMQAERSEFNHCTSTGSMVDHVGRLVFYDIKPNIKIILIAGVPSSQALLGFLITAPPSVCVSAVLGALAVWIQNQKKKKDLNPAHWLFFVSRDFGISFGWACIWWRKECPKVQIWYQFCLNLLPGFGLPLSPRSETVSWVLGDYLGVHYPLSPVIKLGIRDTIKKQRKNAAVHLGCWVARQWLWV